MNLDDLRAVQSRERATDSLQQLRDSFYGDAAGYVADLRAERDRAAADADDPFSSPEVSRLTDEIEMAEQVVEAIYERRVGKIVKQASLAAAGMPGEEDGLTPEERALYGDLVSLIEENKTSVLDVLAGGEPDARGGQDAAGRPADRPDGGAVDAVDAPADQPGGNADATATPAGSGQDSAGPEASADEPDVSADGPEAAGRSATEPPAGSDAAPEPGSGAAGSREPDPTAGPEGGSGSARAGESEEPPEAEHDPTTAEAEHDRTTVRITRDVGEILGVDERVYTLESEDVVTLPEENAEPLLQREAAERLE